MIQYEIAARANTSKTHILLRNAVIDVYMILPVAEDIVFRRSSIIEKILCCFQPNSSQECILTVSLTETDGISMLTQSCDNLMHICSAWSNCSDRLRYRAYISRAINFNQWLQLGSWTECLLRNASLKNWSKHNPYKIFEIHIQNHISSDTKLRLHQLNTKKNETRYSYLAGIYVRRNL